MEYTVLGKTGLRVSRIGLGGIPIQRGAAEDTVKLLDYLQQQGVNYIDTARGYSVSEAYLGRALAGRRDSFLLATKAMSRSRDGMWQDIEASLRDLDTDHIELYQLHNLPLCDFPRALGRDGALQALLEAREQGLVQHIGATFHSPEALRAALDVPELETVMFPCNAVENQGREIFSVARERNVGIIAMKPFAGGNLTDVRTALRYVLQEGGCTMAIPGMANAEEAAADLSALELRGALTEQERQQVERWRRELGNDFCRRCGYCAPCRKGIDIANCFTMANYVQHYDLRDWAAGRYEAFAAHAEDCIGCGDCESRCPYQLPIREKLKEVRRIFGK